MSEVLVSSSDTDDETTERTSLMSGLVQNQTYDNVVVDSTEGDRGGEGPPRWAEGPPRSPDVEAGSEGARPRVRRREERGSATGGAPDTERSNVVSVVCPCVCVQLKLLVRVYIIEFDIYIVTIVMIVTLLKSSTSLKVI